MWAVPCRPVLLGWGAGGAALGSGCLGCFGGCWSGGAGAGAFRRDVCCAASSSNSNLGCHENVIQL